MENGLSNQDDLEQVDNVCTKLQKQKNELEKKQIECMKSMILHHKQIDKKSLKCDLSSWDKNLSL